MDKFDFVCISLKTRLDRQESMKCLFQKLGILDRVTWWLVDKHPKAGVYGCFESHFNIWQKHGSKEFLCVFEDDLALVEQPKDFFDALSHIPELTSNGIRIVNLAPSPFYVTETLKYGFDRGYFSDTAAYVIPRKHLPEVIEHVRPHFGIAIDVAMFDLPSIGRSIFRQNESPSDIMDTPYYTLGKETRESIGATFPGFGLMVISFLKYTRSDPKYRNEENIPAEIVDRRS
jgi:hypothetical protein